MTATRLRQALKSSDPSPSHQDWPRKVIALLLMAGLAYFYTGIFLMLLVLSLIIFTHEWGHYRAMLSARVPVEEFVIGFGPDRWTLYERRLKSGTLFKVKPILLGGYAKPDDEAMARTKGWPKFKILMAGMFMNTVTACVALIILSYATGKVPVIGHAAIFGLPAWLTPIVFSLIFCFGTWLGTPFLLVYMICVIPTSTMAAGTAGPIAMAQASQHIVAAAATGPGVVVQFVWFFIIVSVSLAGMNFLPFYPLDGGHAFEMLLGKICGRHAPTVIRYYRLVGLMLILGLMILVFSNDIYRLIIGSKFILPS